MNRKIIADLGGFIQMRYGVTFKEDVKMQAWFTKLVEHIDEQVMSNYFGGAEDGWHSGSSFETRATGRRMVEKIQALGDDVTILDIGCGDNELKEYFGDRLLGIDPYNDNADIKVSINDFQGKKLYDVVLILGSLNFGDEQTITRQFVNAWKRVKPGGKMFIRANPGITHENEKAKWIDFYEWSHEKLVYIADSLKMEINEIGWDHSPEDEGKWGQRIYAELTRSHFNK